jgi:ParB family chromosome partitioning protein
MEREIFDIYVEDIIPNRFQPRLTFDEKSLSELADSIKQHGIIQPLVVRKLGDKYEIIAGERRYKAAQLAGLQKVPAVIMNMDDKESAEVAVVENIQRRDLSALEEAESYKKLLDKGYLTQEQLATRMGKAQATISNKLRLLSLDKEVKDALLNDKISERHARSLLSLKDPEEQKQTLNKIIEGKLTVRQTDDLIKSMLNGVPSKNDSESNNNETVATESNVETLDVSNNVPIVNENIPTNIPSNEESIINENNDNIVPFEATPFVDIPEIAIQEPEKSVTEMVENIPLESDITNVEDPLSGINIDQIKAQAEDINVEKPLADVDSLLGVNLSQEAPKSEEIKAEEEPRFRFLSPIEDDDEEENSKPEQIGLEAFMKPIEIKAEPQTYTDSLVQEYRQANGLTGEVKEIVAGNLQSAINAITDVTKSMEKHNFNVDVEEFDFEHLYQIIIKIQK